MTAKVFVGGSHGLLTHFMRLGEPYRQQWKFVQDNADGWYANNGNMSDPNDRDNLIAEMAALFKNKYVFFGSDVNRVCDDEDRDVLAALTRHFTVSYCSMNGNQRSDTDDETKPSKKFYNRRIVFKEIDPDPSVLLMAGPWLFGGNFFQASDPDVNKELEYKKLLIRHNIEGSATDGPMNYWVNNVGKMKTGSTTFVKWVKRQNPNHKTMVMMAPNNLNGYQFFDAVIDCVRFHEEANASPDIWVLNFYGNSLRWPFCPILPESWDNGPGLKPIDKPFHPPEDYTWTADQEIQPARTFMGAAWWLINHVRNPETWSWKKL